MNNPDNKKPQSEKIYKNFVIENYIQVYKKNMKNKIDNIQKVKVKKISLIIHWRFFCKCGLRGRKF